MVRIFLAFFVLFIAPLQGVASPSEVSKALPEASLMGQADYRFLAKKLYRAELWAPANAGFSIDGQYALVLNYNAKLSAETLAWASVMEIARIEGVGQSTLGDLSSQLEGCFANVAKGDRITGVAKSKNAATFFVNGRKSCNLSYPQIRSRFFGIWLGPKARDLKNAGILKGEM